MEWRRVLVAAGAAGAFVALAATGALLIVSLAPAERPVAVSDKGLLIERAANLQPFDARPEPPRQAMPVVERPASMPPPTAAARQSADLLAMLREDPQAVPATRPGSAVIAPVVPPPHREVVRPAVASPPRTLPEARPPTVQAAPLTRPIPEPRNDGLLTAATIRQFHFSLRLTPDQEPYWFPVQQALNELGAQQSAMLRAGQDPKEVFGVGAAMRIYSVARPLLDVLREDQKARVRSQARSLGFSAVASQI
jgi:hypothetical protein